MITPMMREMAIMRVSVGETNCYWLQGAARSILVDAGPSPRAADRIIAAAAAAGIRPDAVTLILVTHGHLDHHGAAGAVQDWCGAPIAAHPAAHAFSQNRRNALPPAGTLRGSLIRWFYLMFAPLLAIPPLDVDLVLDDGADLADFGIEGRVMALPGHSPDSLGVLTAGGGAFVGDLLVNYAAPSQPLYLHDRAAWQESCRRLIAAHPQTVYVGHGEPFPGEQLAHIYPPRYQFRWWVR